MYGQSQNIGKPYNITVCEQENQKPNIFIICNQIDVFLFDGV
jgi:hypothetical protein